MCRCPRGEEKIAWGPARQRIKAWSRRSYGAVADSFIAGVVPREYHAEGSEDCTAHPNGPVSAGGAKATLLLLLLECSAFTRGLPAFLLAHGSLLSAGRVM